jgi:hypothetical protein
VSRFHRWNATRLPFIRTSHPLPQRFADRVAVFGDLFIRPTWRRSAPQADIDVVDPPFDRHFGETPAMTAQDEADIIAFLQTLTDGYQPDR